MSLPPETPALPPVDGAQTAPASRPAERIAPSYGQTDVMPPPQMPAESAKPMPVVVLTKRQKAAVIVRVLIEQGVEINLDDLPHALQIELAHEMGSLRTLDKDTVSAVIQEFVNEVRQVGTSFPSGVEEALTLLDGVFGPENMRRLRIETGVVVSGDPWLVIEKQEDAELAEILKKESTETAAVILSKLPVPKSAAVLGLLPTDMARTITYAVSATGMVDPETVRTIGHAIATQLSLAETKAFTEEPGRRVGEILNQSTADTRDTMLEELEKEDEVFASEVRKSIFIFADIATKVTKRDVPKITRVVDQMVLVTALKAAEKAEADAPSAEFILDSMPKRLAEQVREEMEELQPVKASDGDEAIRTVLRAIRDMEQAGEISLITGDEDETA